MRLPPALMRRGFTLIELVVVIALIGILATMLFFTFPSFSGQNTVSSAADRIVGALLIARQRAKRDGRVTGVRVSQDQFAPGPCCSLSSSPMISLSTLVPT